MTEALRYRTWSDDIAKLWNMPITADETLEQRFNRYTRYFELTNDQLKTITNEFIKELDVGLQVHKNNPESEDTSLCSLKMLDSCVVTIPSGEEVTTAYALDFGGSNFRAVRVKLEGNGKLSMSQIKKSLKEMAPEYKKGLMSREATASKLFDSFAITMKDFMHQSGDLSGKWVGVGFTFSFPIVQTDLKNANLIQWSKEFETGRGTDDPVEGMDVSQLLDQALWRQEVPAKTVAVLNDTVGTLLSCAYEKPPKTPTCLIGLILGTGVNGCYFQEKAKDYNYKGVIINTELGNLDKGLPLNDVDLEVDFASEHRGAHLFEKMVSGGYIGEVCRRVIIKVFQKEAPQLAWVRGSLPAEACSRIITDTDELAFTKKLFSVLWGWDISSAQASFIQSLINSAFSRSAGLGAAVVAGMAHKTGRLSAGMGGLTCGIDGSLYTQNKFYQDQLKKDLGKILGDRADLVHLRVSSDGSGKGAGILAGAIEALKQAKTS
eukprot:GHVP01039314.1.p1 GENE.GHVP01039314.1~~GHVP01039314.1.p1  ORF type:complete len:507 (-),score=73.98 GHVP01039314.1:85-1557(-)